MQPKLTIQERLKDLRVERSLTLEQLSAETGISKSALGKYEADDFKDISPFSMVELAKFYGVSTDYLLGLTEQKNHPNTELDALHLGDDAIEVLRTGKFNHRLLSELICHKDFQRFMLDAEIYVDRIADMRVNDMNVVLEAVRQMALMKNGGEENDLYLRTLEVAQIREDEYFGSLIADDLKGILRDIRNEHRPDTMTADETSLAATVQDQLQEAMNFEGSSEEKKIRAYLATIGLDYDALTKEEFVSLIGISYHEGSRKVQIKLSSIHAVKGRTHLATLVLDTYWYKRNLKSIMPWLCNIASKSPSERDAKRLKCHYVAITRAKGLICLAAPKSSISDKDKTNLIKAGWNITEL